MAGGHAVSGVLGAGLILLAVAGVSGLVITAPGWPRGVPYVAGAAGAGCLAVAGGFALAGRAVTLNVAGWLGDPLPGQQALGLAADRLSGLFLVMAFGAAGECRSRSRAGRPGRIWQCFPANRPRPTSRHPDAGRRVRAGARLGRGGHDGDRRVHGPVRLGGADGRVLSAGGGQRQRPGPCGCGADHGGVREGERGGAAHRAAAARDAVALDRPGLVRARAWRRCQDDGAGAAARRIRGQGRAAAVPGVAAARVRGGARPGPRGDGRKCASTSAFTGCGGRWRCWVTRRAGSRESCCCSAGSPRCSASRTPR